MKIDCKHPKNQRWQYTELWQCCSCGRYFWGDAEENELRPVKFKGLRPIKEEG
jgi:hypothetical protein